MKGRLLTGYGTIASTVAAMRAGAQDYLIKPTDAAASPIRTETSRTRRDGSGCTVVRCNGS